MVNWDCKAFVEDGLIKKIKGFNFWNPNRQPKLNKNILQWKTVTTGGASGVDLWLTKKSLTKKLVVKNNFKDLSVKINEINHKPKNYFFGGMDIRMSVQALPEKLVKKDFIKTFSLKLKKENNYRFYIKVVQEDGHQAWSSPIYIKK